MKRHGVREIRLVPSGLVSAVDKVASRHRAIMRMKSRRCITGPYH